MKEKIKFEFTNFGTWLLLQAIIAVVPHELTKSTDMIPNATLKCLENNF